MQTLYELIDFIPDSFVPDFAQRLSKLYYFIKQNKNLTAKEAATLYLGDQTRIKYFHVLKNDLKKELIHYAVTSVSRGGEHRDKVLQEDCYKVFAMYKILLINSKRQAAIELAESLLPKLNTFELYSLQQVVADDLLTHYSVIDVKTHLQKKYRHIVASALQNARDYTTVKHHYSRIISICNTRESYNPSIITQCIDSHNAVIPLLQTGRHNLNRFIYIIIICRYLVVHDYGQICKYADEALLSFPKNHPMIRSLSIVFLFHKTTALVPLGKLKEAKQTARVALERVQKGKFNWHMLLLKRIIICLHAGDYQEAYQLYKAHIKRKCPYPIIVEHWNIIKGYLHVLIQLKLIEPYDKERFYLGKFLNEMPMYSKDKAGNNINILIIQILVQMQRGQYVKIIDRINALKEYVRLYTRSEASKRTNIFMKMIIKMEGARFHRKRTEEKTKTLWQKLQNTPLRANKNLAAEVMPYEVLWPEMLNIIDNKFRATTAKKRIRQEK